MYETPSFFTSNLCSKWNTIFMGLLYCIIYMWVRLCWKTTRVECVYRSENNFVSFFLHAIICWWLMFVCIPILSPRGLKCDTFFFIYIYPITRNAIACPRHLICDRWISKYTRKSTTKPLQKDKLGRPNIYNIFIHTSGSILQG